MECYINDKGKVFISVGQTGEDITYNGFIPLDKEDVNLLMKMLTEMEQEIQNQ